MKKIIVPILALSLLFTVVELGYIKSSPRLGEADIRLIAAEDTLSKYTTNFKTKPGEFNSDRATGNLFQRFYEIRPHKNDPGKSMYKMGLVGWYVLDSMTLGIKMWQTGIFDTYENTDNITSESAIELRSHLPSAVASQFVHINGLWTPTTETRPYGKIGETLFSFDLGWLQLGDMTGANAMILFGDKYAKSHGTDQQTFLDDYAKSYSIHMARTAFVESSLTEQPARKGILYMAYYPAYNKTLVVTYNLPEDTITKSSIKIDGESKSIDIIYPFMVVGGNIPSGSHQLILSTAQGEYSLDFYVNPTVQLPENLDLSQRTNELLDQSRHMVQNTQRVTSAV